MPDSPPNPYEPPRSAPHASSRFWTISQATGWGALQGVAGTGIVVSILGAGAFFANVSENRSPQAPGTGALVIGGLVVLLIGSLVGAVMRFMEVTGLKKVTDEVQPTILPAEFSSANVEPPDE